MLCSMDAKELHLRIQPGHAAAAFGTATIAATLITRFFVIFPAAHFLLDAGMFDQFTKPLDCILNRFVLSQTQLNHSSHPF